MPAHVIALVNMKGGVGKTTLSVALAEGLSVMAKKRVLMIDVDAQASGSIAVAGPKTFKKMREKGHETYKLFHALYKDLDRKTPVPLVNDQREIDELPVGPAKERKSLNARDVVHEKASLLRPAPKLDLIGALPELQLLERQIIYRLGQLTQEQRQAEDVIAAFFHGRMQELVDAYDYIIIDCPPGISAFTEAAVRSARYVFMPVLPEYLSLYGLESFALQVLRKFKNAKAWPGQAKVVLNRVTAEDVHSDVRRRIHKVVDRYDDVMAMFPQEIEQAADFVEAGKVDDERSIRDKYGKTVRTIEDFVRNVLEMTEKALVDA